MKKICADLAAEEAELDAIVAALDDDEWTTMTPAEGWNIQDQIRHLAYYENRARSAAAEPEVFRQWLSDMWQKPEKFADHIENTGKQLSNRETLDWWRQERRALLNILEVMHPKDRLPWYGPDMSALSFATARIMETWAHGQDVVDALGVEREPTNRLRHIAHLGVRTFGWSYLNRQMEVPAVAVRVELVGPDGDLWSWGPEDAAEVVSGPAQDFCLVVVQRRHVDDTRLDIQGKTAAQWMSIAQAFAGPPGPGRQAGMFLRNSSV
jgi:uncharacterized protein (TIGR03084 family)